MTNREDISMKDFCRVQMDSHKDMFNQVLLSLSEIKDNQCTFNDRATRIEHRQLETERRLIAIEDGRTFVKSIKNAAVITFVNGLVVWALVKFGVK